MEGALSKIIEKIDHLIVANLKVADVKKSYAAQFEYWMDKYDECLELAQNHSHVAKVELLGSDWDWSGKSFVDEINRTKRNLDKYGKHFQKWRKDTFNC